MGDKRTIYDQIIQYIIHVHLLHDFLNLLCNILSSFLLIKIVVVVDFYFSSIRCLEHERRVNINLSNTIVIFSIYLC